MSSLKRQRSFRAEPSFKKARFGKVTAGQVKKIVRDTVSEEVKYYDLGSTPGTPTALVANTIGVLQVSNMGLGTADYQRIGRRIKMKHLQLRFSLYQASAAANANIRCMVVLDRSANGNSLVNTATLLEAATPLSYIKYDNKSRFIVLKEQVVQVNNVNSETVPALQTWYVDVEKALSRIYKSERERQTTFLGDTADTAGNLNGNALYFIVISDVAVSSSMATGTARSGLDFYSRLAFTDA